MEEAKLLTAALATALLEHGFRVGFSNGIELRAGHRCVLLANVVRDVFSGAMDIAAWDRFCSELEIAHFQLLADNPPSGTATTNEGIDNCAELSARIAITWPLLAHAKDFLIWISSGIVPERYEIARDLLRHTVNTGRRRNRIRSKDQLRTDAQLRRKVFHDAD